MKSLKDKEIETVLSQDRHFEYNDVKEAIGLFLTNMYISRDECNLDEFEGRVQEETLNKSIIIFKEIFGDWKE